MIPLARTVSREVAMSHTLGLPPVVKIPLARDNGSRGRAFQRPTSDELRGALDQVLSGQVNRRRSIVTLKRRLSPYRSSFNLEEFDLQFDDGTNLELIFKDLSLGAMLRDARQARPAFLYQPRREIQTYRKVLAHEQLGTATCHGAMIDVQPERYWLFLERVTGLELRHVGEFATWQQTAEWMADLHSRLAPEAKSLSESPELQLLRYDDKYYRLWLHRAQAFVERAKLSRSAGSLKGFEKLAARYDDVIDRLISLPLTFIHGEFFPCNVLVQTNGNVRRVCPVDWEMAAIGPGLIDLATLGAGWSETRRKMLASTYYGALGRQSGWPPKKDKFLVALDCCRLHLAVRMLGWSTNWSAPPQHAHNWLGEAMRLAKGLGL